MNVTDTEISTCLKCAIYYCKNEETFIKDKLFTETNEGAVRRHQTQGKKMELSNKLSPT